MEREASAVPPPEAHFVPSDVQLDLMDVGDEPFEGQVYEAEEFSEEREEREAKEAQADAPAAPPGPVPPPPAQPVVRMFDELDSLVPALPLLKIGKYPEPKARDMAKMLGIEWLSSPALPLRLFPPLSS